MRVTCPSCQETYPIDAGFADDDGKRFAAIVAEMEPALGRAAISYMRLFKPPKTALRTARAVKIAQELLDLVRAGSVCRDERGGLRRPASPALWAAGIEQMLAAPGKLTLPLANHHYLRAIVFGLADAADAVAEHQRETALRAGRRLPTKVDERSEDARLRTHLDWAAEQLRLGRLTQEEHDRQVADARKSIGAGS